MLTYAPGSAERAALQARLPELAAETLELTSTIGGAQIVSGSDAYSWTNTNGGVWSNAGNWTDATTGRSTTVAPGAGNAVTIQDNPGTGVPQIISGIGATASLAVYSPGYTVFTGTVAVGGAFWIAYNATGGVALANGARVKQAVFEVRIEGQDVLVAAWPRVLARHPDFVLIETALDDYPMMQALRESAEFRARYRQTGQLPAAGDPYVRIYTPVRP